MDRDGDATYGFAVLDVPGARILSKPVLSCDELAGRPASLRIYSAGSDDGLGLCCGLEAAAFQGPRFCRTRTRIRRGKARRDRYDPDQSGRLGDAAQETMSEISEKVGRSLDAFRENGIAGFAALVRAYNVKRKNVRAYERFIAREELDDAKRD